MDDQSKRKREDSGSSHEASMGSRSHLSKSRNTQGNSDRQETSLSASGQETSPPAPTYDGVPHIVDLTFPIPMMSQPAMAVVTIQVADKNGIHDPDFEDELEDPGQLTDYIHHHWPGLRRVLVSFLVRDTFTLAEVRCDVAQDLEDILDLLDDFEIGFRTDISSWSISADLEYNEVEATSTVYGCFYMLALKAGISINVVEDSDRDWALTSDFKVVSRDNTIQPHPLEE